MPIDPRTTVIDMTPEGAFRTPPRAQRAPWRLRATGISVLAAAVSLGLLAVALTLWLAITVLPVLLGVALLALVIARLRPRRASFAPPRPPAV